MSVDGRRMYGVGRGCKSMAGTVIVLDYKYGAVTPNGRHHFAVVQVLVIPPSHARARVCAAVEERQHASLQNSLERDCH